MGIGAVISKNFQPGMQRLKEAGYNVKSLAEIVNMGEGFVEFADNEGEKA